MTWVDIVVLALLAASVLGGLRQGFIMEIAAIFGAIIALGVAKLEYADVRHYLNQIAPNSSWTTVVAYLLVFLFIWAAIIVIARKIRLLARIFMLGWIDRIGGAVIGLLQGFIFVELLLYLGKHAPAQSLRHAVNHAALTPAFAHLFPYIHHWFPHLPY